MKKLIALLTIFVLALPCIAAAETWEEYVQLRSKEESEAQRLIPKGKRTLKSKDIIIQELNTTGESAFDSDEVTFDYGSPNLSDSSKPQLATIAQSLNDPAMSAHKFFYVDGHTCALGSDENNCKLSWGRAGSVVEYLIGMGVPKEKLRMRGFGESMPKYSNDAEETRSKNRRVVLRTSHAAAEADNKTVCHKMAGSSTSGSGGYDDTNQQDNSQDDENFVDRGKSAPKGFKPVNQGGSTPQQQGSSSPPGKGLKPVDGGKKENQNKSDTPRGFHKPN